MISQLGAPRAVEAMVQAAARLSAAHGMFAILTEGCRHGPVLRVPPCRQIGETNHAGNVYDVNVLRWQGRCREMFLLEHAPTVLDGLCGGLQLVTVESGCGCIAGIQAFEEISIRMRLEEPTLNGVGLAFDYVRVSEDAEELVAMGWQRIACVRGAGGASAPTRVPEPLRLALEAYAVSGPRHIGSAQLGAGGRP